MMKYKMILLAVLCATPLFAEITKEGDGAARLDRETRALSFQLLLQEKLAHFAAGDFPAGKAKIVDAMQRDPAAYTRRSVARQKMEKLYRAELGSALQREIDALIQSTVGKLDAENQAKLNAALSTFIDRRMKETFPAAFDEARRELAEAERRSQIFTAIYPSGKELETLNDANLTTLLLQRFTTNDARPIMEENRPYVRKNLVAPVIAAGRKQQQVQKNVLPLIRIPKTLWQADEIARFLQRELHTATIRELPDARANFIDFPSVQSQLQQRAQNIVYERLAGALPDAVKVSDYDRLLEKEPQFHATWQASVERCHTQLLPAALNTAMTTIHAPAGSRQKITADDTAVRKLFADAAREKFQKSRGVYADRQLARIWQDFDRWLPEMEATELFVQQGEKELPAVTGQPQTAEVVFAETKTKIADGMRKKFSAEAARLKAQQKCVDAIYHEIADECGALDRKYREGDVSFWQKIFGSAPSTVTLEKIIEVYEDKVEKTTTVPLFPATRRAIEIRARAILQQLQETAAKPKPAAAKPEKEPQSFTLSVKGEEDAEILLQLGQWHQLFSDGEDPANAVAVELKRQAADGNARIILVLEIANPALTYRRVAELRNALQQLLPEVMIQDNYRKAK